MVNAGTNESDAGTCVTAECVIRELCAVATILWRDAHMCGQLHLICTCESSLVSVRPSMPRAAQTAWQRAPLYGSTVPGHLLSI